MTIVWTEDVSGVTASYSGFINTSVLGETADLEVQSERSVRGHRSFAYYDGGELRRYKEVRTIADAVIISANPIITKTGAGVGTGDPFSFAVDDLFVDSDYISGAPLLGAAFFSGETLSTMFPFHLAQLAGQTTEVWTSQFGGQSIFYEVIPEPSTLALALIGIGGLVRRRRGL